MERESSVYSSEITIQQKYIRYHKQYFKNLSRESMKKTRERCHGLKRREMYLLSNANGELVDTSVQKLNSLLCERVFIFLFLIARKKGLDVNNGDCL